MKINLGAVDHDSVSGVSADDHHAQAHAVDHAENAVDQIFVENLGGVSTDVSTSLKPDGTGGVEFVDSVHADLASVGTDDHHAQDHTDSHQVGGDDAVTVEDLATVGGAGTFLGSDGDGTVSMQTLVQSDLPANNAIISTGNYTGDGELSQAITGVGFTVRFVHITRAVTGNAQGVNSHYTSDVIVDNNASGAAIDATGVMRTNTIIALGSDGFTVDDGGGDAHPNKLNEPYDFIAYGVK